MFAILALSGGVKAEEQKNYHIQTELTGPNSYSDTFKISPADAPHGIYIIAWAGMTSTYPLVADMIKAKFRAQGFVIADKLEEADLGINFGGYGLPIDDINDKVTHVSKEFVAASIGSAMLTGGISLISTGISFIGKAKGQSILEGAVYKAPLKLNWRGRVDAETDKKLGNTGLKYTADESNADVSLALFAMLLNEWMKTYTQASAAVISNAEPISAPLPGAAPAQVNTVDATAK